MTVKHECTFYTEHGGLPSLPPGATFLQKTKRLIKNWIIVSSDHPMTQWYFKNKYEETQEMLMHAKSKHWYIIHPFSRFRIHFEKIILFTNIFVLINRPWFLAFHNFNQFPIVTRGWDIWTCMLQFSIVLKILLSFFTGYFEPKSMKVVLEPKACVKYYLKWDFIIDMLAAVPFQFFLIMLKNESMRTSTLFATSFICSFFVFIRALQIKYVIFCLYVWTQQMFRISDTVYTIMIVAVIILYSTHVSTCIMYITPRMRQKFFYLPSNSWIVLAGIHDNSTSAETKYTTSLTEANCYLYGFGISPYDPITVDDYLVRFALTVLGLLVKIITFSSVLRLIIRLYYAELKFDRKMYEVKKFIRSKNLPPSIEKKLKLFYEYQFEGNFFQSSYFEGMFSDHLRKEIQLHRTRDFIESMPLFQGISPKVVGSIINFLQLQIFLPGDVIVKVDEFNDRLFFVKTGDFLMKPKFGNRTYSPKYWHYGEVTVIGREKTKASLIALSLCEIYMLDSRYVRMYVRPCTELMNRLEETAKQKCDELKQFYNENFDGNVNM